MNDSLTCLPANLNRCAAAKVFNEQEGVEVLEERHKEGIEYRY